MAAVVAVTAGAVAAPAAAAERSTESERDGVAWWPGRRKQRWQRRRVRAARAAALRRLSALAARWRAGVLPSRVPPMGMHARVRTSRWQRVARDHRCAAVDGRWVSPPTRRAAAPSASRRRGASVGACAPLALRRGF